MLGKVVFTGTFIHTPSRNCPTVLTSTAVFVENGIITFIVYPPPNPLPADYTHVPSPHNAFFFPGFIDTHIHASQYPNSGIFGNSTLLDWLERYTFSLEQSLTDLTKAREVYSRIIRRTLSHGTTTATYFAVLSADSTNLLADLCLTHGQRAFVGRCCMDQNSPKNYMDASVSASVSATERTIVHCRTVDPTGALVRPIITPRFAPTCSDHLLQSLAELNCKYGGDLNIQTHMSENVKECAWVSSLFPHRQSYAHVYEATGLLTEKTVLAHAIHVSDEEVEMVRRAGAGVAHCPVSNMALGSGCAKVQRLVRAGVKVGLGTDVSGGYSVSVLEAARQATTVSMLVALETGDDSDKISVAEALYLATKGGAEVLGIADKVGVFEVGMEWDAMLVGLGTVKDQGKKLWENPVDVFGWEDWEEKLAKWVYTGDDRNTLTVWVKGRKVYQK